MSPAPRRRSPFRCLSRVLLAILTAACATPPSSAYVAAPVGANPPAELVIGRDTAGESCTVQDGASPGLAEVYCGAFRQPSAHVRMGAAATPADLPSLVSEGAWRAAIDLRFACQPPVATSILDGNGAELLTCEQKLGGWPHVALVALVAGHAWFADGVPSAATVMQRAIGVRAGILRPDAPVADSAADALFAERLAARSLSANDIGQFDALMAAGTRANLAENRAAAEAAFRAALSLQQTALGKDNPNTATALTTLALQVSDNGRYAEAATLFDRAAALAPRAVDPLAPARLLHYRGLDALNRRVPDEALGLLDQAAAAYATLVPPWALAAGPAARLHAGSGAEAALANAQSLGTDPTGRGALLGLIEVKRNESLILRDLGLAEASRAAAEAAADLALAGGLTQPAVTARLFRTRAAVAAAAGDSRLASLDLARSARAFARALPESKPLAETQLLRAAEAARLGQSAQALALCHDAVTSLVAAKSGAPPALIAPCLDVYAAATDPDAAKRQATLAEMFLAAQLAQGGITAQQIAQATARLQANARDPRVAEAIRRRQDAEQRLQTLYARRDQAAAGAGDLAAADAQIRQAQATLAEADLAVQAAAPNFGQLAQQVVTAAQVRAALLPHEALVQIVLGPADGWVLALRDHGITVGRVPTGEARIGGLVRAVRAGIEVSDKLPRFDVASAATLYAQTLGPVSAALDGVERLVVAPSGPLLALPFEVLLTGPADPAQLRDAPWLLRRFTLDHVPAPANFVGLRRIAAGSRATRPWFGFGDFVPITPAQARTAFAGEACAESARLLAELPPLPGAAAELDAARRLTGAGAADERLGPAFTATSVAVAPLKDVRILHFAAHALLPAELSCLSEPAIVASVPAGSKDARGALLTATDVTALDLDADLVILSACNSGGPGGATAGESLSGLARAFFYAGARSLLVTHWAVNDRVAAYLIAGTLARMRGAGGPGVAESLRATQLDLLAQAGAGLPAEIAHPFFWAPFAVIGDGGGEKPAAAPGRVAGL